MDKATRNCTSHPAEITIITRSQITCCSTKNNQNSRRIERYLVETRKYCSNPVFNPHNVSEPIRCPTPPPEDNEHIENMTIEQSTEYYNERSWNMYYRIVAHRRQEDKQSSWYSASFVPRTGSTTIEKASRQEGAESLRNDNSGLEEIFLLELWDKIIQVSDYVLLDITIQSTEYQWCQLVMINHCVLIHQSEIDLLSRNKAVAYILCKVILKSICILNIHQEMFLP